MKRVYYWVYLILVLLTAATAFSLFLNFGRVRAVSVALGIASIKAGLIALYYMHLLHEKPLIYGVALLGIAGILILGIGIFPDVALRP